MKKHIHKIAAVEEGSIAWELGIEPGDRLLSIDGHEIEDILITSSMWRKRSFCF